MALKQQYHNDRGAWKYLRSAFQPYFSTFIDARRLFNDCGQDPPPALEHVSPQNLWHELIRNVMNGTLDVSLEALAQEALHTYPQAPELQALAAGRLPSAVPADQERAPSTEDPERLPRALRDQRLALFPLAAAPVVRRLRSTGTATPQEHSDLALLQERPGMYLLLGESGCGKSVILGRLCEQAEAAGRWVIALARAGDWPELRDRLPGWQQELADRVTLVVVDQLREDATDLGHLRSLRANFPAAVLLAAGPLALQEDAAARLGSDCALRLVQELDDAGQAQLLAALPPRAQSLRPWAADDPLRQALTRSPLFLWVATLMESTDPLPQMSGLLSRYLEQLLQRQGPARDALRDLLVHIAQHLLRSDQSAITAGALRELIRAEGLEPQVQLHFGGADAVLKRLVGLGILLPGPRRWHRARHEALLRVIVAQAQAEAGKLERAGSLPEGPQRDVALLVPAFCVDPVAALDQVSDGDSQLWLRGVAELPHSECAAALQPRLARHLPLHQPERMTQTLRQLRGVLARAPLAGIIGLLQALLTQPSRDPDRLGVLLLILDELAPASQSAAVLQERLLSSLGPPPPRPTVHPLPGSGALLARVPVTNQDFAQVFPSFQSDHRSPGLLHPCTGVSALAARLYARRCGGRLPTAQERRSAQEHSGAPQRKRNTPPDARYFVDGGGALPVNDARLRDPEARWAQLCDNVREWCEDGPQGLPEQRYALGGSFLVQPGRKESEHQFAHRADVGLRVLWEPPAAPTQRPAVGPTAAPAPAANAAPAPPMPAPPPASAQRTHAATTDTMRILLLNEEWFSHYGGISTFNRQLCLALAKTGHQVFCFVSQARAEEIEDALAGGVTLLVSDQLALEERARLLLRPPGLEEPPDIIIGHDKFSGPAAQVQAQQHFPSSRWVVVIHMDPQDSEWYKPGDPAQEGEARALFMAELAEQASGVIAVGPKLALWIRDTLRSCLCYTPVHLLRPGLSTGALAEQQPEGLRCLVLGRTEDWRQKGLDIAARAVGALRQSNVELWVRGAISGTAARLQELLSKEAPRLRIRVWNYSTDKRLLESGLRQASVLLMPSRSEGFGLVALEAIALGVPVLVSDRSGLGDLLKTTQLQGAVQAVVPVRDVLKEDTRVWRDRLQTIFDNRPAAFQGAQRLRQELAELWRWEQTTADLLAFLSDLPPPPSPSPRAAPR